MEYQDYIRSFVVNNFLFGDGSQLRDSDSLLHTDVMDSTGILELIFFLEQTWQITIAPAELTPDNMDSVEKISRFIERKCLSLKPRAARSVTDPSMTVRQGATAEKR